MEGGINFFCWTKDNVLRTVEIKLSIVCISFEYTGAFQPAKIATNTLHYSYALSILVSSHLDVWYTSVAVTLHTVQPAMFTALHIPVATSGILLTSLSPPRLHPAPRGPPQTTGELPPWPCQCPPRPSCPSSSRASRLCRT